MEKLTIFHGSDHIIQQPAYQGGKSDNDYGNGFYTTEYEDRARSWAALNGNPHKSIVNVYEIDMSDMKILDLNEYGVLAWIAEVHKDEDIWVRREVNRFLQERLKAIFLDGFVVPGITARYAIQNHLVYHREGNYYE